MKREPVALINAIVGVVEAFIALTAGFGWFNIHWDAQRLGLVMAIVVALGTLAKTLLARNLVTPIAN